MRKNLIDKDDLIDIEEDKDLYDFQLDDEYDWNTDEDLDAKYELTEELIYGSKEAKQIVKDTYANFDFVYGKYYPNGLKGNFEKFILLPIKILMLMGSIFGIIFCTIINPLYLQAIPFLGMIVMVGIVHYFLQEEVREVWWYKWNGKTVTIYKILNRRGKNNLIVYINKNYDWIYNVNKKEWKANRKYECMDSRLLFKYLTGFLFIDKKEYDEVEVYACNNDSIYGGKTSKYKSCSLTLKRGVPKHITKWTSNVSERFEFLEVNTSKCAEIPKSFIEFCEQEGIEYPEENEHLHYV